MHKIAGLLIVAVALCAAPSQAFAQSVMPFGSSGAWAVNLAQDPTGDKICIVSSRQPPDGPANVNLSFVVDSNYTRLFLGYQGPARPTPDSVALSAGGEPLANFLVEAQRRDFAGDLHVIVVDLPDGLLWKVIFPGMRSGGNVTVRAGSMAFSVPARHFGHVMGLLDACALQERKDDQGR